jgi:hypothetical protein
VANGGKAARPPTTLQDPSGGSAVVSEVALYGDVVLRYISGDWKVGCLLQQTYGAGVMGHAWVGKRDDSSGVQGSLVVVQCHASTWFCSTTAKDIGMMYLIFHHRVDVNCVRSLCAPTAGQLSLCKFAHGANSYPHSVAPFRSAVLLIACTHI